MTDAAMCWRGFIRAAAKTSPKAFPIFCRHCICKILQIWSMMLPENRFTLFGIMRKCLRLT